MKPGRGKRKIEKSEGVRFQNQPMASNQNTSATYRLAVHSAKAENHSSHKRESQTNKRRNRLMVYQHLFNGI